jgi:uncharacterized membrane protein
MADVSGPNTDLPALPAWQARSFWVAIVAAVLQVATLAHIDVLGIFGVEGSEQLVDSIMQIVAAIGLVWVWIERQAPNFRLSLSGKKG